MAKAIMASKGVPFSIDDWPSVVLEGLRVLNENNWFPVMTLIVGSPGETDNDVEETSIWFIKWSGANSLRFWSRRSLRRCTTRGWAKKRASLKPRN